MKFINKKQYDEMKRGGKIEFTVLAGTEKHAVVKIGSQNGKYLVKVSLYKSSSNELIDTTQKSIENPEVADDTIDSLIRFIEASNTIVREKVKRGSYSDFAARIYAVHGILDPKSYGIRKTGKYLSLGTVESMVSYTANTIGKMFEENGSLDVTDEQQREYQNDLIKRIQEQDNKNGKTPSTRESIMNRVNSNWQYANEVLAVCRENDPDGNWPVNPLITLERKKAYSPELPKVLPYHRFIAVVCFLVRACTQGIQVAFAALGLVLLGMRVGESAAVQIGKINYRGPIGRYYLCRQIDKKCQPR